MRFLAFEERVVWSAPAPMRTEAVSVRPVRKARASGVKEADPAGLSIAAGKAERRYFKTERDAGLGTPDVMAA